MEFQTKKSYTINELKEIAGDNYTMFLSSKPIIDFSFSKKPVIYSFDDFDDNTKQIYNTIYSIVSSINPNSSFMVFAVGERVNGSWLTDQEIHHALSGYNVQLSSYYPFDTTAEYKPTSNILPQNVWLDQTNSTHKVIIPLPNE